MSKCEICETRQGYKSAIVGEFYYKNLCEVCYENMLGSETVSSGYADYERGRDYEEHAADVRQPTTDGKPDKEFIRLYPDTARKIFTDDEIGQAFRS